jgi:hypothetical protein
MEIINFSLLPDELLEIIQSYIPIPKKIMLCKTNYIKYHSLLRQYIIKNKLEKYIRNIVCRDYDFVFEFLLRENLERWLNMIDYEYKNIIFYNYIFFIRFFCAENESFCCQKIITKILQEKGLCQNPYKNNPNIYIK